MSADNQFLLCLLIVIVLGIFLFLVSFLLLIKYFFDRFDETYEKKLFNDRDINLRITSDLDYLASRLYALFLRSKGGDTKDE